MKWPFITRELTVAARRRLGAAVILYVVLLAAFTLIWGFTAPGLTGRSIYESLRVFEWGLLATLMPWVAARCAAPDRGRGLVLLSALTARRPSSIVVAKIVSLAGVLVVIAAAGVPPSILAQKMSALPASTVLRDFGSFVALAVLASAATMGWLLASGDEVTSWIGASATTAAVLTTTSGWQSAQVVRDMSTVFVAVAIVAAVAAWCDRSFRYCHE